MSANMAAGLTDFSIFLVTLVAGAAVVVSIFISKLVRRVTNTKVFNGVVTEQSKTSLPISSKKSSEPSQLNKSSNKKKYGDKNVRNGKQVFHHHWLLTSLKGHSSSVLDMEFSPNGKFLATCGEDGTNEPDPGGGDLSGSSSEGNKENAVGPKSLPGRRQKKNRGGKEEESPGSKKMTRKTRRSDQSKKWISSGCNNMRDAELSLFLRNYVLTPKQIALLGYPVESMLYPGRAIIYKTATPRGPVERCQLTRSSHLFDVNAREFVPSRDVIPKRSYRSHGGSLKSSDEDCSGDSDDRDSDKEASQLEISMLAREQTQSDAKRCVRCGRSFFPMLDGVYMTQETCLYHWGKLQRAYGATESDPANSEFSCCKGKKDSKGCTTAKLHVWSGVDVGVNGPLDGYVKTKRRKSRPPDGNYGVYSLDCEMCYTTHGLELTKITLVATDGRTVYDSFVVPENAIIDYNTRFSGITAKDLKTGNSAKCLREVQNDLTTFINADTILIGHGLENDLKALKMIHSTVIDTSVIFPHYYGLPYRRSLRSLVKSFLKRDIQSCGHDSFEDAKACMELVMWRVKKDLKNSFDQKGYLIVENF